MVALPAVEVRPGMLAGIPAGGVELDGSPPIDPETIGAIGLGGSSAAAGAAKGVAAAGMAAIGALIVGRSSSMIVFAVSGAPGGLGVSAAWSGVGATPGEEVLPAAAGVKGRPPGAAPSAAGATSAEAADAGAIGAGAGAMGAGATGAGTTPGGITPAGAVAATGGGEMMVAGGTEALAAAGAALGSGVPHCWQNL